MPIVVVPVVGIILAALMAALLLFGSKSLSKLVAGLIPSNIPVIGSWLHDRIVGLANFAVTQIEAELDAALAPITALIDAPVTVLRGLFDAITGTIADAAAVLDTLASKVIPHVLAKAMQYARQLKDLAVAEAAAALASAAAILNHRIDKALQYARDLATLAERYAAQLVAAAAAELNYRIDKALQYARDLATMAEKYAESLVAQAVAVLSASIATVDRFAHAAYADALAKIGQAVQTAERYADAAAVAAAAESVAVLERGVHAAVSDVWGEVTTEVAAVEGVIATDLPDIQAALRAIATDVPGDLAAVLAGTAALSIPMLRYLEKCGIPNCRNLSAFGRELQALLGMVEDAAFLALLAELVTNPSGAARELNDVLVPIATDALHGAESLLGVR